MWYAILVFTILEKIKYLFCLAEGKKLFFVILFLDTSLKEEALQQTVYMKNAYILTIYFVIYGR
jgi:hypothetical protein